MTESGLIKSTCLFCKCTCLISDESLAPVCTDCLRGEGVDANGLDHSKVEIDQ